MSTIRPNWPAPAPIQAFTTTRNGPGVSAPPFAAFNLGARCGDAPQAVFENRTALITKYGLPSAPYWLQQVHGVDVAFDDGARGHEPQADAAISKISGSVLAVLTADCLPVLFCNSAGTEIAAAHAGWRGLVAGMLEATVKAMDSKPSDLLAWIGPAAGPKHYEIDETVRAAFLAANAQSINAFTETRPGHYLIDLPAIARQRLAMAGVHHVYGGEYCTISDTRFYSHRREQHTGRMATIIWMS
jgi:YfiH family protein